MLRLARNLGLVLLILGSWVAVYGPVEAQIPPPPVVPCDAFCPDPGELPGEVTCDIGYSYTCLGCLLWEGHFPWPNGWWRPSSEGTRYTREVCSNGDSRDLAIDYAPCGQCGFGGG